MKEARTEKVILTGSMTTFKNALFLCLLVLVALLGNIATSFLAASLKLPVFFDTIFTVAITFYAGLIPGMIAALLFNPVMTILRCTLYGTEIFYYDFLYALFQQNGYDSLSSDYFVCIRIFKLLFCKSS